MTDRKMRATRNAVRAELDQLRDDAGATPPTIKRVTITHAAVDLPSDERKTPDWSSAPATGDDHDGVGTAVDVEYNPETGDSEAVDRVDYLFPPRPRSMTTCPDCGDHAWPATFEPVLAEADGCPACNPSAFRALPDRDATPGVTTGI